MSSFLPRIPVVLLGLAVLLLPAPLWAQDEGAKTDAEPAYINVRVPADAKLVVEGDESSTTRQSGEQRRFVTPPLPPGKKYYYTLKVTFTGTDGKPVTRSEKVYVEPGKTATVDLVTAKADKGDSSPRGDGGGNKTDNGGGAAKADPPKEDKKPKRNPDVIYVPTPQKVVDKMLELANVKKEDVVYDLGCGDGRIVVTAAKKFGCKAFGFDIDPERIKDSNKNVKDNKVESLVTIQNKDIFTLDLSKANVVTLYLLPELNVKLVPQLRKLKPGSRIISHDFDMRGYKPDKEISIEAGGRDHTIYLWTTPLKKEK